MSDAIPIPEGLKLSPMKWRVYAAIQDWADREKVQDAIDGHGERASPPAVIICQLKLTLHRYGLTIEKRVVANIPDGWPGNKYRLAYIEQQKRAA